MGDVNYKPVIDDMAWSYSRIRSYFSCPYQWYLKYLCEERDTPLFFSAYGSFVHDLLDAYYGGRITAEDAELRYLAEFTDRVPPDVPSPKIFDRYFADGLRFLSRPAELPLHDIRSERVYRFTVGGHPFVARLDVTGTDERGGAGILDHKSRLLKPRSGWKKPTASDTELDEYLRQLYLYSVPVLDERGELPTALYFNCFRGLRSKDGEPTGEYIIRQPFEKERFAEAKRWAVDSIETIRNTEEFRPDVDYFKCRYLCGVHDRCEYYQMNFGERRRGS